MKSLIHKTFFFFLFTSFIFCPQVLAFTKIVDTVFDGMPVDPEKISETLDTIKKNKLKNKTITNPLKLKPDKLFTIYAMQADPLNIKIEIDTSGNAVRSKKDIQLPISNEEFLDKVTEAIMIWESVDIAKIKFAPVKFASGQADPEDGKNVITFRAIEDKDAGGSAVTIVNFAKTDTVIFMNKAIMVKPGTILDVDIVIDPANNPCVALTTTEGPLKAGGDDDSPTVEGGINPDIPAEDLDACAGKIIGGDLTGLLVEGLGDVLGLTGSAITSSATSPVSKIMVRYALTNDDKIGLANIYPNPEKVKALGTLQGKVILNKKPVRGAHIVIEDVMTGEPVASAVSDIVGKFKITAIPGGTYNIYAEPLDGPVRKKGIPLNFFGFTAVLNFTTGLYPEPVVISEGKTTKITVEVHELSASAFNINYQTNVLKEADVNETGGSALLPIKISPGQTLTNLQFWGDNISTAFGTLSVSGPGITVSNVMNTSIMISPNVVCEDCDDTPESICNRSSLCPPTQELTDEPDQVNGITTDITCASDITPGPRNIIFTGDQLDPTSPSFGLRDQITGGLFVTE